MLQALLAVTVLSLVVWCVRHLAISIAIRRLPPLRSDMFAGDARPCPSVSFLVAGKEEENNIEACLRSLIAQDYPALEIIAINDRSADRTGEIMDRVAAGCDRLKVVHVRELPPDWFGKNNAMREGVAGSTGQWLAFTDADCMFACPRTLRIAVRYAEERGADFLSVLPVHEAQGFWERVVQPACSGILMIWFNPVLVNNPRRRAAYANGAFMLMRRSCYDRIGGHHAVRRQLNEDIHMARLAKAAGQRLLVVSNEGLYSVRMYATFREIWNGWSRIFLGCFGTLGRLFASLMLVLVFTMLPWAASAAWLIGAALGRPAPPLWDLIGALATLSGILQLSVTARFYALSHVAPVYGLLYPLGAVVGCGALLNAMKRAVSGSAVTWRGSTYHPQAATPG